ncbi:MAG: Na/Pi cotransporter family protein [Sphingomonadaceae bacterium]
MDANLMLFSLFGGVYLLLYGIRLSGEGMQRAAGNQLRRILGTLTQKPVVGLLVGAGVTAVLQSSGATTVMLVSLVGAGLMTLRQAIGVILGADVGTTITVQLIAFKVLDYAILLVGLGLAIMFSFRRSAYRHLGEAILGFGFIFLAMKIMIDGMAPLRQSLLFQEILLNLVDMPLLTVLVAAVLTALVASSAATIGLAITLALQGLMPLPVGLAIVLGANLGTCATALVSALGTTPEARRVAITHTLFKLIGVLALFPFLPPLTSLTALTAGDVPRQIANFHTLFNVALAVVFLPFTGPFAKLVTRLVPESKKVGDPMQPRYLDESVLDTPALALGQATRETLRMADLVQEMFRDAMSVFRTNDLALAEELQARDDVVDRLEEHIKHYLTRLTEQELTPEQSKREVSLLFMIQDLENIGDIVDKNLMELAKKKIASRLEFSAEGAKDIEHLTRLVAENLNLAVAAYATQDADLAQKLLRHKLNITRAERELKQAHIRRLHDGVKESMDTSAIHLDVLSNLERINSHATNIAFVVLGEL